MTPKVARPNNVARPTRPCTEGDNQTIEKDTTNNIVIKITANHEPFNKLFIDEQEVSLDNYQVTKGSTVLTILPNYLNTLSLGTHNIKITFKDNKYVETTLTVKEKQKETQDIPDNNTDTNIEENNSTIENHNSTQNIINSQSSKNNSPKTGDNIIYYAITLIISALGIILSLIFKKVTK